MADNPQPTLFILAEPNGAGKSTLYHDRIRPITRVPFINADEIARQLLHDKQDENVADMSAYSLRRVCEKFAAWQGSQALDSPTGHTYFLTDGSGQDAGVVFKQIFATLVSGRAFPDDDTVRRVVLQG